MAFRRCIVVLWAALSVGSAIRATSSAELEALLRQRFAGDRTGACVAAAVIEETVARAYFCADPETARPIDEHTAFEIGSVTKTMTATLLADLIERGELSLDDPLTKLLPAGTEVPTFEGRPITLKHVVTHTSGLPPLPARMQMANPRDPYAALTEEQLLGSLADVELTQAPGSSWQYSNFAMMVLSLGIARHEGQGFETLLEERLFEPLAMRDAFVAEPAEGAAIAVGHLPNRRPTSPWNIPADMAGVGGVRASLEDMIHYVEAQLGKRQSPLAAAIARTHAEVLAVDGRRMAMNWTLSRRGEKLLHAHEGGTGGFSSIVAFDLAAGRGVVALSDTSLTSVGGLGALGLHLLGAGIPVGEPRTTETPPQELLDALAGTYQLEGGPEMKLKRQGALLIGQAQGQFPFQMAYDSAGDFYPEGFDALLRPVRRGDGGYDFLWFQGGGMVRAVPTGAAAAERPAYEVDAAALEEYAGVYPLMDGFDLTVTTRDGKLLIQGTGQSELPLDAVAEDVFVSSRVGVEIEFERDDTGEVVALTLRQGGNTLRGERRGAAP